MRLGGGTLGAATPVRHVGLTVSDLGVALAFWEGVLGRQASARTVLERPYVGALVGMPEIVIDAAFVAIDDGVMLELLHYRHTRGSVIGPASFQPGHAHLCLAVDDIAAACEAAVAHGARSVSGEPIVIDAGPNAGTRAVYLRVPPDWHTVELFERSAH